MTIRLGLLVTSVTLTVMVVAAIARSSDEEWRRHQKEYYRLTLVHAASDEGRAALRGSRLEILQDVPRGFGEEARVDRCRTCHMAIDDPAFEDGKHPLRTHPPIPVHAFSEFGCTVCHEGDGRALDAVHAHGKDHFWTEPLLPKPFIESACARCHPDPYLAETPHLARGRALFERYACVGCHTVRGVSRGKLGPELSDVGHRLKVEALRKKVENPAHNQPLTIMPRFGMPAADVQDLVVFLKSNRGRSLFEDPVTLRIKTREWKDMRPAAVEVTVAAGQTAITRRGCASCHRLDAQDGSLAPDLTFAGLLRDQKFVVDHLADPRVHTYGSNMPQFWMSDSERQAIAAALVARTELALAPAPAEQYRQLCARCHGDKGAAQTPAGLSLVPRPRQFNNAKFFNWLPEERAYKAIREGVPGTAMPPFGKILPGPQAQGVFDWIRSEFLKSGREQRKPPRAVKLEGQVAYSPASVARGRAAFAERCVGCHGRIGDGKGPNAADMLPRPRNLTSGPFVGHVEDARLFESITYGIVGTGMPAWDYLPDAQRWDLVSFVRFLSKTGPAADNAKR